MKMFEGTLKKYIEEIKKGKLVFKKNTIKPKIIIETMLNIEKIINNEKKIIYIRNTTKIRQVFIKKRGGNEEIFIR